MAWLILVGLVVVVWAHNLRNDDNGGEVAVPGLAAGGAVCLEEDIVA